MANVLNEIMTDEKQECVYCKIEKPLSFFYEEERNTSGYMYICKPCLLDKSKAYYKKHKEKRNRQALEWSKNNREKSNGYAKKSHAKLRDRYEAARIMYEYGITFEDYDNLLKKQNGVCAICSNKCKNGRKLSIDHNHQTGKVRGLLCHNCNSSLGLLGDNIKLLIAAVNYLKKND